MNTEPESTHAVALRTGPGRAPDVIDAAAVRDLLAVFLSRLSENTGRAYDGDLRACAEYL